MTDDVLRLADPGLGIEVDGDEVEICRLCCAAFGSKSDAVDDVVGDGCVEPYLTFVALITSELPS